MEIIFRLWKAGLHFRILRKCAERRAFCWFLLEVMWGKHWVSVEVYRTRKGSLPGEKFLSFHVKLPFFLIANDVEQISVHEGDHYRVKRLVSCKILKWQLFKSEYFCETPSDKQNTHSNKAAPYGLCEWCHNQTDCYLCHTQGLVVIMIVNKELCQCARSWLVGQHWGLTNGVMCGMMSMLVL